MPYLIDGHNLIAALPGLSLGDVDDELELVSRLQAFCRQTRRNVEVFFDQAPPGRSGARRLGRVTARFVAQGRSADEAIRLRLEQLGGAARNWTVISSDRGVLASARAAGARILTSQEFARLLADLPRQPDGRTEKPGPEDITEWMRLFGGEE